MRTNRFAAASAAAFLFTATASAGADAPVPFGPDTHLVEAKAPEGAIVVFVPSGAYDGNLLIATREDAAAYRKWAEESHPGRSVALQWDVVPFEMDVVADRILLACVRKGDEGVDPSGRFRFTVAADPDPSSGRVSLLLANPPAAKDFDPYCCASNIWILSRGVLFERWGARVERGEAASVRAELAALKRSERFRADPEWRAAAKAFVDHTRDLFAVVRFRNRNGTPVRVRVGGAVQTIPGGESWEWSSPPDGSRGPLFWEARDVGDGPSSDADWSWSPRAEIVGFDPMGEDSEISLKGTYGNIKPLPFLAFPDGAVPGGVDVGAELRYADEVRGRAAEVVERDGRRGVECETGREVRQCIVRADGWKDAVFAPAAGTPSLNRGNRVNLAGDRMERDLPPWPTLEIAVQRNGFGGTGYVRIGATGEPRRLDSEQTVLRVSLSDLFGDVSHSETNFAVSWWGDGVGRKELSVSIRRGGHAEPVSIDFPAPVPEVPWPSRERVEALVNWFAADNRSALYYIGLTSDLPDAVSQRNKHKRELFRLLGFRPVSSPDDRSWGAYERTFDEMVRHIEGCRGCLSHRSVLPPHAEALRALLDNAGPETKKTVEELTRFPKTGNLSGFVKSWWQECKNVLGNRFDPTHDAEDSLRSALDRWVGGLEGEPREQKLETKRPRTMFAEVYAHVVCCAGSECSDCRAFRSMLKEKDFESRRAALFRDLMKFDQWNWGKTPRPTDEEIDRILQKFTSKEEGAQ